MIAFDQVSKRYGRGQAALQDVTFTLERGDFAFITGSSGAGKTTLIKMIYREVRPSSGRVLVDGQDLGALKPRQVQLLRRRLGVVFQSGRLIGSRDVYENVTFVLRAIGMGPRQQKERALAVLRWVGLTHRMRSFPGELSGGEQQRIAIARAVAADPEVLLADEPTGNLDAGLSQEILEIFQKINGRGTTVLVATHDQELIQKTRRRVIRLEGGRLMDERLGRRPGSRQVPAEEIVTITDGLEAPEERVR